MGVAGDFAGAKSNISLNLNEAFSSLELEGGTETAQFGGIRDTKGGSSVDFGNGGKLVLAGGREESYKGKLQGEGSITVRSGSKQTIVGDGGEHITLVSGGDGELHLQGENARYERLSVEKEKNEAGHDIYGKLYVECQEDGTNSRVVTTENITLQGGTTTYLQMNMKQGLEGELLSTERELSVAKGAKLGILLTGDGSNFIPEKDIELVLMSGEYYANDDYHYRAGEQMELGDLQLDPLLEVYYQNVKVEFLRDNCEVVLRGELRTDSPLETVTGTQNSTAGSDLLWNTKDDAELRDTSSALNKVFCGIIEQMGKDPDAASGALAALAGGSAAVLGSAQRDAMRGQIGRMRDRATQLGLADGYSYDNLPYWHAWVEGVGSYSKLSEDGDESGYTLSSWGGTLGVDADLTEKTALGMAVTALRGDLKTNGGGTGSGDLDSYYVSAMLRVQGRRAAHTVVASIGADDAELERRVSYGTGSYSAKGNTSGESVGALYEFTYDLPGNAEGSALLQPLFTASVMHGSMKAYDETSSDGLPLHVDKQDWTTATLGVGVRWMCTLGEEVLNRSVIFEARGAVQQDIGDTQGKVRAGLLRAPDFTREVKSAEVGSTSVQLGVGLRAPMSDRTQLLFNAGSELRSSMTSWNLAAGFRYDF